MAKNELEIREMYCGFFRRELVIVCELYSSQERCCGKPFTLTSNLNGEPTRRPHTEHNGPKGLSKTTGTELAECTEAAENTAAFWVVTALLAVVVQLSVFPEDEI